MRVVLGNLAVGYLLYGGSEVQIERTRDALSDIGVEVVMFSPWEKDLFSGVDVLHWFHVDPGALQVMHAAKRQGVKVVVSSIYWPLHAVWLEQIWSACSHVPRRLGVPLDSYASMQRRVLDMADRVLVASGSEGRYLQKVFRVSWAKVRFVPVGTETAFVGADPGPFVREYGLRDFVLCVGRIEPRKNQLRLLAALADTGISVVMIGDARVAPEYYSKCLAVGGRNVHFLGSMGHDNPLFRSAYAASRVLAMPSTLETPGLVALEGALAGARLAITERGCTKEYFGSYAEYVNPFSVSSIRSGVFRAMDAPEDRVVKLRARLLSTYSWRAVAERLLSIYEEICTRC
ncbi:MAG TPA: glycosyltransferase family 4 protein [Firmicutes bacterium]|nr:glycosyltransferase family 4 protein [Bacillota bacterium]